MKCMFAGAYWGPRRESKESAAGRLAGFFRELATRCEGRAFAKWDRLAKSRAAGLRAPIETDPASLAMHLKGNYTDFDRKLIEDIGYTFGAWNGGELSILAAIGSWNKLVTNSVVLDFDTNTVRPDAYRPIMEALVRAFDPENAVITSSELIRDRPRPWEVGLLTYERGGQIEEGRSQHQPATTWWQHLQRDLERK